MSLESSIAIVQWRTAKRCKNRDLRQVYQTAYEQAHQQLLAHQLTLTLNQVELNQWRDWATVMVTKFQRTTSITLIPYGFTCYPRSCPSTLKIKSTCNTIYI